MSRTSLRLVTTADLDAYEADQKARLAIATSYEIALNLGDELGTRRAEALAADYDMRHPDEPPLLAEIDADRYLAVA